MIPVLEQFAEIWGASLWRATWQGAIAIGVAWAIHRWCTFLSPRVVSWLWRVACLKLLVALFLIQPVTLALLPAEAETLPVGDFSSQVLPRLEFAPSTVVDQHDPRPRLQPPAEPAQFSFRWPNVLLPLWLIGVVYCVGRTAQQWVSVRRLVQAQETGATDDLLRMCQVEARRLEIRRLPRLQFSSRVESPLLVGVWRPAIILPENSGASFNDNELGMMLAHELAHLKRHDLAWNWLPTMAAWLFFFHPLVWVMVRRWSEAQEAACDELLIQRRAVEPADYGRLLVKLSPLFSVDSHSGGAAVGVLGSYHNLERRILTMARVRSFSTRRVALAACLLSVTTVVGIVPWRLVAQGPAASPATETAESPPTTTNSESPGETRDDSGNNAKVHEAVEPAESQKITVTNPQAKDVTITQQYLGKIHAHRHIKIRAVNKGILEAIPVKEGQAVKQGDSMFKVIPTLYQMKADAESAEMRVAQLEYAQAKKLFNDKVVSQDEVAMREAKLTKAKAIADLARAEWDFATVKAPFNGIIDRLQCQQGSLVQEGDLLTTLSDNSVMWVYFNVPEARYLDYMADPNQGKQDMRIELVLANGKTFPHAGKLGAIEADFNVETGSIPFRADFPNPDLLLRHGQSGTVLIRHVLNGALVVPQRATFESLGKRYVFVVDKDDVAHQREIVIQNELDDHFVIAKGVGVDDKIILDGIRKVRDGEKVAYEAAPNSSPTK